MKPSSSSRLGRSRVSSNASFPRVPNPDMNQQQKPAARIAAKKPYLLALFQKRIDGDDALLELARLRFNQASMGMELYGGSIEELRWLLGFKPWPEAPVLAHLPRDIDLLTSHGRSQVIHFAKTFATQIYGFVIHDRQEYVTQTARYQTALSEINAALLNTAGSPFLFVEYAAGLAPHEYCALIESGKNLELVSACVDIGHLGIWQARKAYNCKHPGEDICALTPADPMLPELIHDVQASVESATAAVSSVTRRLAKLGKPLHFHLHDGHPLSTESPFGVSDHLSFFADIRIPFIYKGKKILATMFGPEGLMRIVAEACDALSPALLSFTLEIHPAQGREQLEGGSHLFSHWTDKTNAERMNGWLMTLMDNHRLLAEICNKSCRTKKGGRR